MSTDAAPPPRFDTTADDSTPVARQRWRAHSITTGIAGLLATVLLFTPIITTSTYGEPGFAGRADEIAAFFAALDQPWSTALDATASLGALVFLWFAVGLFLILKRIEPPPALFTTVALASAVVMAAYGVLNATWSAAANRGSELLPDVLVYAFDEGNLGFANQWMVTGSFAIAVGWVLVADRASRSVFGWWAIVAGIGLIVVRYAWEGSWWFGPYAVFWLWVIAFSIVLLTRRSPALR